MCHRNSSDSGLTKVSHQNNSKQPLVLLHVPSQFSQVSVFAQLGPDVQLLPVRGRVEVVDVLNHVWMMRPLQQCKFAVSKVAELSRPEALRRAFVDVLASE